MMTVIVLGFIGTLDIGVVFLYGLCWGFTVKKNQISLNNFWSIFSFKNKAKNKIETNKVLLIILIDCCLTPALQVFQLYRGLNNLSNLLTD